MEQNISDEEINRILTKYNVQTLKEAEDKILSLMDNYI
jgi:hypothetical protein